MPSREVAHALVLGVQDHVLARVGRQPQAPLVGTAAQRGQLLGALLHLSTKPRQVGVSRIGSERRRHAVHLDAGIAEVAEDRAQMVDRHAQVRLGLPATRVVRREATAS